MRQKCLVKLYYGTYTTNQTVYCHEDDENDVIISNRFII
jgi:hypothetical protein